MLPAVTDLSGLCGLGGPVWCCQREDAWGAGMQLWLCVARQDSAKPLFSLARDPERLCHKGVLQRLEDRRGKSAFRSCEQHPAPREAASPLQQQPLPEAAAESMLQFFRFLCCPLPGQRHCTSCLASPPQSRVSAPGHLLNSETPVPAGSRHP